MEGFTLVLLIGWIVLLGCFAGMYFMDKATKNAAAQRSKAQEQSTARRR